VVTRLRLDRLIGFGAVTFSVSMLLCAHQAKAGRDKAAVQTYRVVHVYPHDPDAFTQGLLYDDGHLYESTGLEGRSSLRKVELESGRVLQKIDVPGPYFAEGLAKWQNQFVQLTWVSHLAFVYDQSTFRKQSEFHYSDEGWGLTHDGRHLIMSDGSDTLRYVDPRSFQTVRKLRVSEGGQPVTNLNELEYIKGEIFANVWQTDLIARISPATGRVNSWVDLSGLLPASDRTPESDVLNGIAYDAKADRLFVTGKRWPKLYEIKIVPKSTSAGVTHPAPGLSTRLPSPSRIYKRNEK
jgi:glutamine cyclotransferase